MDIDGLGEKLVAQLVDASLVRDIAGLYRLDIAALSALDRMGGKSSQNLLDHIEASKRRPLARLLFGLGIRRVGEHVAGLLALHFQALDRLMAAGSDELLEIAGIGPDVSASVVAFFNDPNNRQGIADLLAAGVSPVPSEARTAAGPLEGKTFVFTGSLQGMSRAAAQALVVRHGGKTAGSVSSSTTYVVAGEDAGSKLAQARKRGIPVLTEAEFLAMLPEG